MILLCAILKVVNGKSLIDTPTDSTDVFWPNGEGVGEHSRILRQIFNIRMNCPHGMRYIRKRCREIITEFNDKGF